MDNLLKILPDSLDKKEWIYIEHLDLYNKYTEVSIQPSLNLQPPQPSLNPQPPQPPLNPQSLQPPSQNKTLIPIDSKKNKDKKQKSEP